MTKARTKISILDILEAIDKSFPFAHAADGDSVGLLVGDGKLQVTGILICLDPSLEAIVRAQELGANLIVSHHPIRFNSNGYFNTTCMANTYPERVLAAALSARIAVIAAHTNVDVAQVARCHWGDRLGLERVGPLSSITTEFGIPRQKDVLTDADPYGEVWSAACALSLDQLATRVAGQAGCSVKVYGDGQTMIKNIVTATGSGGGRIPEALMADADVIISGEFGYHAALAAVESGLCLIEMGHDVSELPLVQMIADAISLHSGIGEELLHREKRSELWRSISADTGSAQD